MFVVLSKAIDAREIEGGGKHSHLLSIVLEVLALKKIHSTCHLKISFYNSGFSACW